ncbi:LiaF domain-containing protein [Neptunicella sp. SCSIO 80796]|uniref:LiaF domain-containing protein n=1 Tax=Neptunicella plasticusilytica TaxID=3117012 RepID=UPI003A4D48E8
MAVKLTDRPIEKLREEVIDQLIMNYSHGQISLEAFERRLDIANQSDDHQTLAVQVEDLTLTVDESYTETKNETFSARYTPGDTVEQEQITNILSSNKRGGIWDVPKELKCFSLLGNMVIDLTQARFTHPTVRINLLSVLSDDTIYVPDNVNVILRTSNVLGSTDTTLDGKSDPAAPTVIIEGRCILASTSVKMKRTVKQRFIDFAEQLKTMLN